MQKLLILASALFWSVVMLGSGAAQTAVTTYHYDNLRTGWKYRVAPVVSFVDAAFGGLSWRDAGAYLPAQVAGCIVGAIAANVMFSLPAVSISVKDRASPAHFLSEVIATLGLMLVIFALARSGRSYATPAAVGAYIGAAYFFTSSASFANPAITVGRMFSNTFAGIAPSSAPSFIGAQIVGGILAVGLVKVLYPGITPAEAADVTVPHGHAQYAGQPQSNPTENDASAAGSRTGSQIRR